MTRFILICGFFLAMDAMTSFNASAGINGNSNADVTEQSENGNSKSHEPVSASSHDTKVPVTKTVPPVHQEHKSHLPKMDELPHIHHYHKERVKKVKRHHKKIWTISMLIMVLCNISILVMAYMHVTPH